MQEAIDTLSEPNRLATVLFYLSGYSIEEIAALQLRHTVIDLLCACWHPLKKKYKGANR